MNIFLGTGVSRGEEWLPDEVAKAIVKEKKLLKGQTISKQEILDYLKSKDISPLLATDVAMVLRDMFGLTPTFNEGKDVSTSLISELSAVLEGKDIVENSAEAREESNAVSLSDIYEEAIQEAFNEVETEEDEAIIAALSYVPFATLEDIALLDKSLDEEDFEEIDECLLRGGTELAEAWFAGVLRPHLIESMPQETLRQLDEVLPGFTHAMRAAGKAPYRVPAPPPQQSTSFRSQRKAARKDMMKARAPEMATLSKAVDPLLQRQQRGAAMQAAALHKGQEYKGAIMHGKNRPARIKQHMSQLAQTSPGRLPSAPQPSRFMRAARGAMGVARNAASAVGTGVSGMVGRMRDARAAAPAPAASRAGAQPQQSPGLFRRIARGAASMVGRVARGLAGVGGRAADYGKAAMRDRMPGLSQVAFGDPSDREKKMAGIRQVGQQRRKERRQERQGNRAARLGRGGGWNPTEPKL